MEALITEGMSGTTTDSTTDATKPGLQPRSVEQILRELMSTIRLDWHQQAHQCGVRKQPGSENEGDL